MISDERVFFSMQKIPIFTLRSVEPRMEIIPGRGYLVYHYPGRQDGIQFAAKPIRFDCREREGVEMRNVIDSIYPSVGSSSSSNGYFRFKEH